MTGFGDVPQGSGQTGVLAAIDPFGNPLAAFAQSDGGAPQHSESAVAVDLTPPSIDAFDVPGTVVAGSSIHATGAASDDWGPVTLSWDFGDGSSGSGGAVDHTFTGTGARTVTLTATDAGRNSATRSATVGVTAATHPAPVVSGLKLSPKGRIASPSSPATPRARRPSRRT